MHMCQMILRNTKPFSLQLSVNGYSIFSDSDPFIEIVSDDLFCTNLTQNITAEGNEDFNLILRCSHEIIRSQWFVNDTSLLNTSIVSINYIKENQAILTINNISKKHHGVYEVHVWDALNQTSQSYATVHVYYTRKHTDRSMKKQKQ